MKNRCTHLMSVLIAMAACIPASVLAMKCATADAPGSVRQLVVISDLHFGVGKDLSGQWDPTEDFRWSKAFDGFLRRVSDCGKDAVDLVIAGDTFELWQPPKGLECKGVKSDTGCTPEELRRILANSVAAHRADLEVLGAFADRGTNRLYFVPGNHDSALVLDACWELVRIAVAAKQGRVQRVANGIFVSEDGRVVIEHGHQIGQDVNGYPDWPAITRKVDGVEFVDRPWGEQFVQVLFNDQERTYAIIDNLSPETAGVRYRIADKGMWNSVSDVARFIKFNLFETALSQKLQVLGADADSNSIPPWELDVARRWGHLLFARALPPDDPFRQSLMADDGEARSLQNELDAIARDRKRMPDEEVRQLCDLVAIQSKGTIRCLSVQLGAVGETVLVPKRWVIIEHLRKRMRDPLLRGMNVFIYAHTHLLETPWPLTIQGSSQIVIVNTGAFQRLVNEPGFLARAAARNLTAAESLRRFRVEDLAACYTAVFVPLRAGLLEPVLLRWHMEENAAGDFLPTGDPSCT